MLFKLDIFIFFLNWLSVLKAHEQFTDLAGKITNFISFNHWFK